MSESKFPFRHATFGNNWTKSFGSSRFVAMHAWSLRDIPDVVTPDRLPSPSEIADLFQKQRGEWAGLSLPHTSYPIGRNPENIRELPVGPTIPVPVGMEDLITDVTMHQGLQVLSVYDSIHKLVTSERPYDEEKIKESLDDLQMLFGAVKRTYDKETLEYTLYGQIQGKMIDLAGRMKEGRESVRKQSEYIEETLRAVAEMRKAAIESGQEGAAIVDTGRRIGGMKIYTLK